jgi:hypothetical protein
LLLPQYPPYKQIKVLSEVLWNEGIIDIDGIFVGITIDGEGVEAAVGEIIKFDGLMQSGGAIGTH